MLNKPFRRLRALLLRRKLKYVFPFALESIYVLLCLGNIGLQFCYSLSTFINMLYGLLTHSK